jgi:hypothetical protein
MDALTVSLFPTMATLVQPAEHTEVAFTESVVPSPERTSVTLTDLQAAPHILHILVKTFLGTLILPFLLLAIVIVFLATLTDFAFFRLKTLRNGPTPPKGMWEF